MNAVKGKDGEGALRDLLAKYNAALPETRMARTPRGGRHVYFQHPGCKVVTRTDWPAPDLDVRGDGGYVIMPPSVSDVGAYAWISETASAPLPDWLRELVVETPKGSTIAVARAHVLDESERVRDALRCISAADRNTWRDIGFALKAHFGESGWALFDEWSRTAPECYDDRENRSQWKSFKPDGGIAIGSLFHLAKENGWQSRRMHYKPGSAAGEYLGADGGEPEEPEPVWTAPQWPQPLAQAAFHGLAGDVVGVIDQHTEADPAAVLSMFLAAFGNMAGASAHFMAEARRHPARAWPVLVGETAKGRKGSAWSSLRYLLAHVDEHWVGHCTASGLSSGEGLIWAVRDPIVRHKKCKDGSLEDFVEDEGVADKRMLTVEEEFSAVLKVAAREGNTVSDLLRRAWDHGDLRTMTKNSPAQATGAHVTVIGHITKPDLARLLSETDALNGFGNRHLWLAVRRSKLLPDGGALHVENLAPLTLRLRQALDFARKATLIERSDAAKELWHERYPVLTADQPGLFGALTNRAEAQVMRLALIYALLDCSPQIDVAHLQAALAVWDFCFRSTRFIFGESLGDRVADRILDELRCAGSRGLTRNDLREIFHHNLTAAKIEPALALLHRQKLAHWSKEPRAGGGRPAIVWRCTPYAKNAIIAELLPPTGVTAFTALGGQQPEAPPNNPIGDVGTAKDTKLQPLHDKKTLIEEFA
jgi:hypothetical protein